MKNILVLAPHIDDGEFGCGGTIARMIEEGNRVWYAAFSNADKTMKTKGLNGLDLENELHCAISKIGVNESNVVINNFPVREFPTYRQDILDAMIRIKSMENFDTIFLPSSYDTHQDHQVVRNEGFRAFKGYTILGYELPWNCTRFETSYFVKLDFRHIELKTKAIECYRSQLDRAYCTAEFIQSLAKVRGLQAGTDLAEAFEVIRVVV